MNASLLKNFSDIFSRVKQSENIKTSLLILFSTIVCLALSSALPPALNPYVSKQLIIGGIAFILALSLAVTYFFAFQFFDVAAYLYIFLGWSSNAIYLLFEFFFDSQCPGNIDYCLNYSFWVYILSLVSTVAFFLAASKNISESGLSSAPNLFGKNALTYTSLIPWHFWLIPTLIISIAIFFILTFNNYAALNAIAGVFKFDSISDENKFKLVFTLTTLSGQIATAFTLMYLGYTFKIYIWRNNQQRPELDISSQKEKRIQWLLIYTFPLTFYAYGMMQFIYPFKLYLKELKFYDVSVLDIIFGIAAFVKFINICGLIAVLLQIKFPEFIQARDKAKQAQKDFEETKGKFERTILELELTQSELKRRNNLMALGAIAASIEHDLKTPLANLETDILTMKSVFQNNTRIQEFLIRLEEDKHRISAIAKVVPFIRGSKDFYNTEKFMIKDSAASIVRKAIRSVKAELRPDPQKFFFKFEKSNNEYWIRAYSPMIEQVLSNILKNSYEAIQEKRKTQGHITGVITINLKYIRDLPAEVTKSNKKSKKFKRWVGIEISDNGCGIAPENIKKLTSLFSTKVEHKANGGIGLYIAKKLLKAHEALIFFESQIDVGTKVSLFFPEWTAYQEWLEKEGLPPKPKQAESEQEVDLSFDLK